MTAGGLHGWTRLPDGAIVARFVGVQDDAGRAAIEVLVWATSRDEAVKRAKAVGMHHVKLHDNPHPPGPEEVRALLESGQDLVWRSFADTAGWQRADRLPRLA